MNRQAFCLALLMRRFLAVGMMGFVVEATIIQLFTVQFDWAALSARFISFPSALTLTWWLNRRYTFAVPDSVPVGRSYMAYTVGQAIGAILSFFCFVALIHLLPTLEDRPIMALIPAALLAFVFNFVWARQVAFRPR